MARVIFQTWITVITFDYPSAIYTVSIYTAPIYTDFFSVFFAPEIQFIPRFFFGKRMAEQQKIVGFTKRELAAIEESRPKPLQRTVFTKEEIKKITDELVRLHRLGSLQMEAHAELTGINVSTLKKYFKHFNKHKTYFVPKTRGRRLLLSKEQDEKLITVFTGFRRSGFPVHYLEIQSAARGMFTEGPAGLGQRLFSRSWAVGWCKRNGLKLRSPTTNRTIPQSEIVEAGTAWYADLARVSGRHPSLYVNADEFFLRMDLDVKRNTVAAASDKTVPSG
jgi:hypothetical protein